MILSWEGHEIARVIPTVSEFPALSGKFMLLDGLPEHIHDYISFCFRHSDSVEHGEVSDSYLEEEESFVSLIESENWLMTDEKGKVTPILVPVFIAPSFISWRQRIWLKAPNKAV